MHEHHNEHRVRAPILTRFIDHTPAQMHEAPTLNSISIEALHDDIKQNLEHLLNARMRAPHAAQQNALLTQSTLTYGIEDFSGYNFLNDQSHQSLCKAITKTIHAFEPRLNNVAVILLDNTEIEIKRALSIRIEATVQIADISHATIFNSSLDVVSKNFTFNT